MMKDGIHLIMPMAGSGTRFAGYNLPKPLIRLQGKPMFYWAAQSIVGYTGVSDITFVVLQDHIEQFAIDEQIRSFYPDAIVRIVPEVTKGAVITCMEGTKGIIDEQPVLMNDCDHAFICTQFIEYLKKKDYSKYDGALLTFTANSPNYSYVMVDAVGEVIGTKEKEVVSNEAICGAYYFRDARTFTEAATGYLKNCSYREYFTSGVYNELIDMKKKIRTFAVEEHIPFGTPDEYDRAQFDNRLKILERPTKTNG